MPGLLRGMARTAAIVGTAEATRNAVDRHSAQKDMQAQANAANAVAAQQAPPPQYYAPPPPPPPAAPAPMSQDELMAQLQKLGDLKAQGILTDAEFQAQKAKLLANS